MHDQQLPWYEIVKVVNNFRYFVNLTYGTIDDIGGTDETVNSLYGS